jgi:glycosyltransferase involved in cell wall biosynthesis
VRTYHAARYLATRGHEVHVVTQRRRSWNPQHDTTRVPVSGGTQSESFQVHTVTGNYSNEMSIARRLVSFSSFALKASHRILRLPRGDVVVASSTPLTTAIPGIFSASTRGGRFVLEVRDLWPEVPVSLGILRQRHLIRMADGLADYAYRHADGVVALSSGMAGGIRRRGYEGPLAIIPNGCDHDLLACSPAEGAKVAQSFVSAPHERLILYAGKLSPSYGSLYLVDLAHALQTLGAEHQVVALVRGQDVGRVRIEAQRRGILGRNLHLLPAIPREDLPRWLSAADVALSLTTQDTAMQDNSANKFFDAIASGTPIAINYGGWQAELIAEHDCGIVLPSSNPRAAAVQLSQVLDNPLRLAILGKHARMVAQSLFRRDNLNRELETFLIRIAK